MQGHLFPVPIRRQLLAPCLLTLLAAFLRLYRLGDYVANIDHAYPIAQAIRWLELGEWPALGQDTSVTFANPSGMSYAVALPWLLTHSRLGVHLLTSLVNVLAVPLTYRLVRSVASRDLALVAMALAAFNPWLIYHSHGTWVQGLMPFWATLTFALLAVPLFGRRLAPRDRRWLLLGAGLSLTALTQMYLLGFVMVIPAALIWLMNRRRMDVRAVTIGLVVLGLASGLYGSALLRNWSTQQSRLTRFFDLREAGGVSSAPFEHALRFVTGRDFEIPIGNDGSEAWKARRAVALGISLALTIVVVLGLGRAVWRVAVRKPDAGLWLATLIWWLVPVAALSISQHQVHVHYLILSVPAGYFLAAPILAPVTRTRMGPLLAGILGANAFVLMSAAAAKVAAQPIIQYLDQMSLNTASTLQPTMRRLADQYQLNEFYVDLDSAALTATAGRPLEALSWAQLTGLEIFPLDRPAVYVRLQYGEPAAALYLAQRAETAYFLDQAIVTYDVIPAMNRGQLRALPQVRVEWPSAQGLTLVGYDIDPHANNSRALRSYWVVEALAAERGGWLYAPYLHLLDPNGVIVVNASAAGLPGYAYRIGDVFVAELALPAGLSGSYGLELGLYDGVHGLGAAFMPAEGESQPFYTGQITLSP